MTKPTVSSIRYITADTEKIKEHVKSKFWCGARSAIKITEIPEQCTSSKGVLIEGRLWDLFGTKWAFIVPEYTYKHWGIVFHD
jgi:hypothetical protein